MMEQKIIETKEEAREYAIEWQQWVGEQKLSYSQLAEWNVYFTHLAEKFDLIEDFIENGII